MKPAAVLPAFLLSAVLLLGVAVAGAQERPPAAAPPQRPQRIVSLNMCADQYLIALADREQVAALTRYARDPNLSWFAAEAQDWPVTTGSGEEVLALAPDLIIDTPFRQHDTSELLAPFAIPTLQLGAARNFDEIVAQTRAVAAAIGHPERGERLVAEMEAALAGLPAPPAGERPVAVHYQRRGFVTGTETLLDEIMARAGLRNLAELLGRPYLARVSLEEILAAEPDLLLLSREDAGVQDLGTELLLHPALQARYPEGRRLVLSQAATVCGGPSYPAAARSLAEQAAQWRRAQAGGS